MSLSITFAIVLSIAMIVVAVLTWFYHDMKHRDLDSWVQYGFSVETLRHAKVVVVAAGMDGALPSVVGGLVSVPVIALPTSVGYGLALDGLAPMLTMMNACAPNVCVVNVDNGFGAGYLAALINGAATSGEA